MELITRGVFLYVLLFLVALIPSWAVLLAYDHIAEQVGWVVLEVTLLNVFCVAIVLTIVSLTIVSNIFKSE